MIVRGRAARGACSGGGSRRPRRTRSSDGAVYLRGHDDLIGGPGRLVRRSSARSPAALLSVVWPCVTRRSPVAGCHRRACSAAAAAGLIAWRLGTALGPDSLRAQLAAGVKAPITPLVLHTPVAVLFAPMVFAVVRALIELVGYAFAGVHTDAARAGRRRLSCAGRPRPAGAVTARPT